MKNISYEYLVDENLDRENIEKYDKVRTLFYKATKKDPNDVEVRNNLGVIHLLMENYDNAMAEFYICNKQKPDDIEIMINKAITHYSMKDFESSLETYKQVLKLDPIGKFSKGLYEILENDKNAHPSILKFSLVFKNCTL